MFSIFGFRFIISRKGIRLFSFPVIIRIFGRIVKLPWCPK